MIKLNLFYPGGSVPPTPVPASATPVLCGGLSEFRDGGEGGLGSSSSVH